jgi:hypothetical protein
MNKPTFASVTNELCTCGTMQRCSQDPAIPITYSVDTGDYQLEFRLAGGECGHMVLYHCPFCGGCLPQQPPDVKFNVLSIDERTRLLKITHGINSIEAALERLGKPDYDLPSGLIYDGKTKDGTLPRTTVHRVLRYCNLSRQADVCITEMERGHTSIAFQVKAKQ